MYVVHIASELAPIAKVGGLADVVFGLSKEVDRHHNKVDIILPKYDSIDYSQLKDLEVVEKELWTFEGSNRYNNTVWSARLNGLRVLLIEAHHPQRYFERGAIYGFEDDAERFLYFCRVALEYLFKSGKHPNIIHLHDWPTAAVAPLYKEMFHSLGLRAGGIIQTIHNLQYQGKCSPYLLSRVGLRGENYLFPDKLQDPLMPMMLNLLKGGIEYADAVTTVSPSYEKEIRTPEGSCGLHDTLVRNSAKLKGILNGIDETYWNPEEDRHLVAPYATRHVKNEEKVGKVIGAKEENKRHLRSLVGLLEEGKPLIASVTRLAAQKSPELIEHALRRTLEKGGQFILLGSAPSPEIQKHFLDLQKEFEQNKNAAIIIDNRDPLAHLVFAAADMFIIPSLFEPCGLTQMIALRYGTVPLARKTGGLADTVFDCDTSDRSLVERNGFTFDFPDAAGIDWVIDRAIALWQNNREEWKKLMLHGMAADHSWKHAAKAYLELYKQWSARHPLLKIIGG